MLEQPATFGVAFFVRAFVANWGFEAVLSTFESSLLLAQWINTFHTVHVPSPGGYCFFIWRPVSSFANCYVEKSTSLESVLQILPAVWSSVDGVTQPPLYTSYQEAGISVLEFWSHVFCHAGNKPFVNLLGQTLFQYAEILKKNHE
jgi:hypothetical protein